MQNTKAPQPAPVNMLQLGENVATIGTAGVKEKYLFTNQIVGKEGDTAFGQVLTPKTVDSGELFIDVQVPNAEGLGHSGRTGYVTPEIGKVSLNFANLGDATTGQKTTYYLTHSPSGPQVYRGAAGETFREASHDEVIALDGLMKNLRQEEAQNRLQPPTVQ